MEEPPGGPSGASGHGPAWGDAGWAGTAGNWAAPAAPAGGPGVPVPPLPWDPHYDWAAGQQPKPRNYRRQEAWILAGAGGVLLLAMIAFIAFSGVRAASTPAASTPAASTPAAATPTSNQLTWDQLRPGDCLAGSNLALESSNPWPTTVTQVACTRTHEAEVFYAGVIWAHPPQAYPGKKAVDDQATARCTASFAAYDGTDESESAFSVTNILDDNSADWSSGGNDVACVAFEPSFSYASGGVPVNYSIKGSKK